MNYVYEYGEVRALAGRFTDDMRRRGIMVDADELTQLTFLRFFETGLDRRVIRSKGSALSLLKAVLSFIVLESARRARRDRRIGSLDSGTLPAGTRESVQDVLELEQFAFISEGFDLLSERDHGALLRVYGPFFGRWISGKPTQSDYVIAHRAIEKLRKYVRERGLTDD